MKSALEIAYEKTEKSSLYGYLCAFGIFLHPYEKSEIKMIFKFFVHPGFSQLL